MNINRNILNRLLPFIPGAYAFSVQYSSTNTTNISTVTTTNVTKATPPTVTNVTNLTTNITQTLSYFLLSLYCVDKIFYHYLYISIIPIIFPR
ncbi:hypothetical protein MJ1_0341 [Nanobdella aerobiophila]|uniref:Uncharacterized protein n=1 Tax=Nanobdella aerobiophila TaxID=2586965 RepID=A0A915WSN4_9ARCH|nr:hypothetical protein [Nanobdella aerobiophila]BBL45505.1 hypothetical protein MJ1_0341 [Nanobdella aerobiophila]